MRNPLAVIVTVVVAAFVITLGVYYVQEGSFAGAGARMDDTLVEMKHETGKALENAGEATENIIDDIKDGPDETPADR